MRDSDILMAEQNIWKQLLSIMEAGTQCNVVVAPSGNDKIWSILSHLSAILGVGFVLPLVVYLAMRKESEYVAANAREALNFHISVLIYAICCIPLVFILIGIPMLIVLGVASLVLAIIAAVKASDGECYRYPLTIRLVP
jgi:uncharacterized Tic20 family protein